MALVVRVFLVLGAMLAAVVIAPEAPAFGVVQGMLALVLITAVIGALALLEHRRFRGRLHHDPNQCG